jgi:quercetin dioxygenase-like cupin family protein
MKRDKKIAAGITAALLTIVVGTAFAFSNVLFTLGTLPNPPGYDFGSDTVSGTYIGVQPTTVQFHTFAMRPGETVPWHYHKALAYAVLERGTLTETHLNSDGTCSSPVTFSTGAGFVEEPYEVHTVTNTGKDSALVTWATAFPEQDEPVALLPQFKTGGINFVSPPPFCGQ